MGDMAEAFIVVATLHMGAAIAHERIGTVNVQQCTWPIGRRGSTLAPRGLTRQPRSQGDIMCGIVSIFSRSNSVSAATLVAAPEILHHRGPDGRKHWISPTRRVGLGHTRLSIIDLTTGDQPLASEDGQVHAVVNGEFYDHVRIRAELEARGHRFATRSDSEILVHLYQER